MSVLNRNKLKIIGGAQTAKKTLRLPVCPSVFTMSEKNEKSLQ